MKNSKAVLPVLAILLCVSLSCTFLKDKFANGGNGGIGGANVKNLTIPTIDPNEPFPALSTDAFDTLTADVPELAKYRETVLAAERDAIKGATDDMRSKSKAANEKSDDAMPQLLTIATGPRTYVEIAPTGGVENDYRTAGQLNGLFNLIPVAKAAEPDMSGLGPIQQLLMGHQIGFFMTDEGKANPSSGTGSKTITMKDEKSGEVQATATVSIETAGGVYVTELTTKVSMPLFGLDANSKVSLKGNPCPDSEGKVDLFVKSASNSRAGRAGSVFYDKNTEARILVTVGDDANLASTNLDLKQATHSSGSGQQVDFITSQSGNGTGESYSNVKLGDMKIERGSKFVSPADQQASEVGLTNAFNLAIGALQAAKERWQGGGCVKIEANSPGTVQPSSTTAIPVTVRHKWEGSEIPSKLEAVLKGETSLEPTSLPKTPGTLTYTAPSEKSKNATISLTASSRRGRAKLDLTASTAGQSFYIYGDIDDAAQAGDVCDTSVPFTVPGTLKFNFTPNSPTSGTYTYTGPYGARGSGDYEIFPGGGNMAVHGEGCIMGHCDNYSHNWHVKPIDPKSCG